MVGTTDGVLNERGISRRDGFLTECYVEDFEFLVPLPDSRRGRRRLEPLPSAEKGIKQASGASGA